MNIQEKIDVLVAFRDGKKVESRVGSLNDSGLWSDLIHTNHNFNFGMFEYRIKKEPEVVYKVKTSMGFTILAESVVRDDVILKKYIEVLDNS